MIIVLMMVTALLVGCQGTPGEFDKTVLVEVLSEADVLLNDVQAGTAIGQVSPEGYAKLKAATEAAKIVNNDDQTTQVAVDSALKTLDDAIGNFYAAVVIPYIYQDDFTGAKDVGEWVSPNAEEGLSIVSGDAKYGDYLQFILPTLTNSRSFHLWLPQDAQVGGQVVIDFDIRIAKGYSQGTQFAVLGKDAVVTDNWHIDNKYVVKFDISEADDNYVMTDKLAAIGMPNDTWINVSAVMDFDAGTSVITLKDATTSKILFVGDVPMAEGTDGLGGLYVKAGRYDSVVSFDNIKVYSPSYLRN